MSKKVVLLLATIFLVVVAIAAPVVLATTQVENGSQTQDQTNATPAAVVVEQAVPSDIDRAYLLEDEADATFSDNLASAPAASALEPAAPDGVARRVPVERGAASGELFEVRGQLKEGDLVVTEGNERLFPGQPVVIIQSDSLRRQRANENPSS